MRVLITLLVLMSSMLVESKKNELTHAKYNKYFGKANAFCAHHHTSNNDPTGLRSEGEEEDLTTSIRITGRMHPLVTSERECNGIPDSEWVEVIPQEHFRRVRYDSFSRDTIFFFNQYQNLNRHLRNNIKIRTNFGGEQDREGDYTKMSQRDMCGLSK